MKSFSRILILSAFVGCIIMVWLVPGINKAKTKLYTRIYENTDLKQLVVNDSSKTKQLKTSLSAGNVNTRKKYKHESISTNSKLKDIKPYMFSRAIQFQEDLVLLDSVPKIISDSLVVN